MSTNDTPLVSILLPVYNAGAYLHDVMESILAQTFPNFEVVVVDDGSTDDSNEIVETYAEKDERIRLIRNCHDFIESLNLGLAECRGKYVARMDADDKMNPNRLAMQVEVMESNSDIAFCSSYMQRMGAEDIYNSGISGKVENLAETLLLGNFISHPTVMLRQEFLHLHQLQYRKCYDYAEDYKLWTEIAEVGGSLYIIPKPLIAYRISEEQVSRVHHEEQYESALRIKNELIEWLLNQEEVRCYKEFSEFYRLLSNLNEKCLLAPEEIFELFYRVLMRYHSANHVCLQSDKVRQTK